MQSTSPASLRSRQRGLRLGKSNFKIKNEVWRFIFIFPIAHFDFSEFFSHLSCLNKTRIFFISFNVFCDASCLRKKKLFWSEPIGIMLLLHLLRFHFHLAMEKMRQKRPGRGFNGSGFFIHEIMLARTREKPFLLVRYHIASLCKKLMFYPRFASALPDAHCCDGFQAEKLISYSASCQLDLFVFTRSSDEWMNNQNWFFDWILISALQVSIFCGLLSLAFVRA